MTIKAIETTYGGCRFRSRLEARWAVLFDTLKITWQYEPQGYEFNGWHYLPDFYLPDSYIHVEVKGTDDTLANTIYRLREFVQATQKPLIILGDIPNASIRKYVPAFHGINPGPKNAYMLLIRGGDGYAFVSLREEAVEPTTKHGWFAGIHPSSDVVNAYTKARSARFEHGQTPIRPVLTTTPRSTTPAMPPESAKPLEKLAAASYPPHLTPEQLAGCKAASVSPATAWQMFPTPTAPQAPSGGGAA